MKNVNQLYLNQIKIKNTNWSKTYFDDKRKNKIRSMSRKFFLKLLKRNTDRNYHTDNALLIAFRYGNRGHQLTALEIYREHTEKGHLEYLAGQCRFYLLKCLIQDDAKIWECL